MSGWSSSTSSRSIASSRSVSARAGSYTTSKALTALAADAVKFALAGTETKHQGDHFIHLQSELGDRRYRKLCEDANLILTAIHYCQEGLDIAVRINQDESLKQAKDLINHDYLVLTLEPGDHAETILILAHKLRGGVHVSHVEGGVLHDGVRCFTVPCRTRMRLWEMVAILKLEDPGYCLRSSNCWDYAKNTAKRLVKACAEVGGVSAAERARLLKEHDDLEANLAFRHMENVAKALIRRFSASSSRDSVIKTPGASDIAKVSSSARAPQLSSSLIETRAASDTLARLSNSPKSPQLSPPSTDTSADSEMARVSNFSRAPQLSSSLIETRAASDILARMSNSPKATELSSPLIDSSAAADIARVSSSARAAEPSSSLTKTQAASEVLARVSNSPKATELSSPLIATPAPSAIARASSSSPDLSSSPFEPPAASDTLARVWSSARAPDLSSPPTRFQDFQQVADPVALVLESSEAVRSARVMEQLSSRSADQFPLASTGKVCLQIVFLMFWLVLNHVGLGPWVTSLFGRTGSG